MRLKQYINELSMAKGVDIEEIKDNYSLLGIFKITDTEWFKVRLWFDNVDMLTIEDVYDVKLNVNKLKQANVVDRWEIIFADSSGAEHISKKPKEIYFKFFAALQDWVTKKIKQSKPESIVFSDDHNIPGRAKLYTLFAKKIEKGGYVLRQKQQRKWLLIRKDLVDKTGWRK